MQTSKELYEGKADKDYVLGEFDVKADKRLLESKVNHSLFNKATDEINKMIKEVEVKLEGNESSMNNLFHQLTEDVDGKLDRLEMDPLKGWVESRLKELNQKIAKSQPGWSDNDAAGLRKQLIQRFHCLSCDKSINMMPKNPIPSLPSQASMSNTRSPRPYTIFELNQIRQHSSKGIINQNIMNFERALLERQLARIRKSDVRAFIVHYSNELESLGLRKSVAFARNQDVSDYYARTRACGGLHTMTFPHRRTILQF
ncbi:glutamine-rich protein 2-like [Patella vulgata]|uniref:glutamine-rich protein 2-like n=1 Tax=Patella vulgata TaxID=6465 RepID=UPI0024A9703B|nr:glutamine-rich protein 2-like [Patella vulgata]